MLMSWSCGWVRLRVYLSSSGTNSWQVAASVIVTRTACFAGRESFHALYYKDGVHPSAVGTYLESCVIASVISGKHSQT